MGCRVRAAEQIFVAQPTLSQQIQRQEEIVGTSAALVWNGDLPRLLQQMLFDAADGLTEPAPPRPSELAS